MKIKNNILTVGVISMLLTFSFYNVGVNICDNNLLIGGQETSGSIDENYYDNKLEKDLVNSNEDDGIFDLYWEIFDETIDLMFMKNTSGSNVKSSFRLTITDVETEESYEYLELFEGNNYYRKNLQIDDDFSLGTVELGKEYLLKLEYYQGSIFNIKFETYNVIFDIDNKPEITIDSVELNNQSVTNINDGSIDVGFTLNEDANEEFDNIFVTLYGEEYQSYILLGKVNVVEDVFSYDVSLADLSQGNYSLIFYGEEESGDLIKLNSLENLTIGYDSVEEEKTPTFQVIDGYSISSDSVRINLFYSNNGVDDKDINYYFDGVTGYVETNSSQNFYTLEINGLSSNTIYNFEFWIDGDSVTKVLQLTTKDNPFVYSPIVSISPSEITSESATFEFSVFDYLLLVDNEVKWKLNDITNDTEGVENSVFLTNNSSTIEISSLIEDTTYELILSSTSNLEETVKYEKSYVFKTASLSYVEPTITLNSIVKSSNIINYDLLTFDVAKRITSGQVNIYGGFSNNGKMSVESIKEISLSYDNLVTGLNGDLYLEGVSSTGDEYTTYLIIFDINYLDENGVEKSIETSNLDLDLISNDSKKLVLLATPTSVSLTTWLEEFLKSSSNGDESLLTFSWEIFMFIIGGVLLIALTTIMLTYRSKFKKMKNIR